MPKETRTGASDAAPTETRNRWRKLHTLSGAVALGAFLTVHLVKSASALGGEGAYAATAGAIARSSVAALLEVIVILVPLAFHVGYGLVLLRRQSTPDLEIERFGDRRLWIFQRVSGSFVLLFVLVHLWELPVQRAFFGLSPDAFHTRMTAHLSSTWASVPYVAILYLLGIAAATFHFANGLFAATAAWNILPDPSGRRLVRIGSSTLGAVLFLLGSATVVALATGTRLLPSKDADSAPCGSGTPPGALPAGRAPAPSR